MSIKKPPIPSEWFLKDYEDMVLIPLSSLLFLGLLTKERALQEEGY
jgi:hypothetical protein